MERKPRFSAAEWDFLVFALATSVALFGYFFNTLISFLGTVLGILLLVLRLRNADLWNKNHDFSERIPAGSKFNRTFFLILSLGLIQQVIYFVFIK